MLNYLLALVKKYNTFFFNSSNNNKKKEWNWRITRQFVTGLLEVHWMRHFKCDLQMNCCHESEKTKLEVKLLVRRGLSPNMGPESCLKGFILQTVIIEKRDLTGWVRELFFRCIASISTILLRCWWSLSIALEAFSLGQESTWHVSVTGGSSLLATGRWCQSVYVRVEIGTSALS